MILDISLAIVAACAVLAAGGFVAALARDLQRDLDRANRDCKESRMHAVAAAGSAKAAHEKAADLEARLTVASRNLDKARKDLAKIKLLLKIKVDADEQA